MGETPGMKRTFENDNRGLAETRHLLKSPENARRLMTAMNRASAGLGNPESVEALAEAVGIGDAGRRTPGMTHRARKGNQSPDRGGTG